VQVGAVQQGCVVEGYVCSTRRLWLRHHPALCIVLQPVPAWWQQRVTRGSQGDSIVTILHVALPVAPVSPGSRQQKSAQQHVHASVCWQAPKCSILAAECSHRLRLRAAAAYLHLQSPCPLIADARPGQLAAPRCQPGTHHMSVWRPHWPWVMK
jgi:hypothetical protein